MKLFGMTWLGWLNFLVFQWFGVRLKRYTKVSIRFGVGPWIPVKNTRVWMTRVVPLTGWWSDYRYF